MPEEQTVADSGLGLAEFLESGSTEEAEASSPESVEGEEDAVEASESEEATEGDEATPESEESSEWDVDDNPWKAKAEEMERRYVETRDWTTRVNQELSEIKKQNEIVERKIDGTYIEDEAGPEPTQAEMIEQQAQQARVSASIMAANHMYGEEQVKSTLFEDDAPFRQFDNDPVVQGRVLAAEAPAIEAMRFMAEHEFFEKYGREPDAIIEKIRSEVQEELETELNSKVKNQFDKRLAVRKKQISGVAKATGAPDKSGRSAAKGETPTFRELSSIVNNGFV